MRAVIIFYLKPFPIELPLVRPFKHEFKDIFQKKDRRFDDENQLGLEFGQNRCDVKITNQSCHF